MGWPKLKRDYDGLKVRTNRPIKNGAYIIAEGTICDVRGWFRGLELTTPPCTHCGIRVFINRVDITHVDLIEEKTDKQLIEEILNNPNIEEKDKIEAREKYKICLDCPKTNDCFSCGVYEWWITVGRTPPPASRF